MHSLRATHSDPRAIQLKERDLKELLILLVLVEQSASESKGKDSKELLILPGLVDQSASE